MVFSVAWICLTVALLREAPAAAERTVNDQPPTPAARLVFVTNNAFQIQHRGCILTPGVPEDFTPFPRAGAALLLRRPEGTSLSCRLAATELVVLLGSATVPISLAPPVHKSEVPAGTEVWLVPLSLSSST